ncbi:MAG: hypothetical protein IK119_07935, partial [Bacteroidales bacterium]|nr:hypothetical protein [Bacteroidales bacterium]
MKAYRIILSCLFLATAMTVTAQNRTKDPNPEFKVIVNTASEPVGEGDWAPTVESLSAWECPEWFR